MIAIAHQMRRPVDRGDGDAAQPRIGLGEFGDVGGGRAVGDRGDLGVHGFDRFIADIRTVVMGRGTYESLVAMGEGWPMRPGARSS